MRYRLNMDPFRQSPDMDEKSNNRTATCATDISTFRTNNSKMSGEDCIKARTQISTKFANF